MVQNQSTMSPLELMGRIELITKEWSRLQRKIVQQYELGMTEYSVMEVIVRHTVCTPSQVATEIGSDRTAVSRSLRALRARGYVVSVKTSADMRVSKVTPTLRGVAVVKDIKSELEEVGVQFILQLNLSDERLYLLRQIVEEASAGLPT